MSSLQHLAIIMDGNGRWAQLKGRPRVYGHIKGARVAKKIMTHASKTGLKYLTLYAFSTENWLRPESEVALLMRLLKRYLVKETENLIKENIRFTTIGDLTKLPFDVRKQVELSIEKTQACTGLQVCFALSYGSRQEIIEATQRLSEKVKTGALNPADITEKIFSQELMTQSYPDPDLVLRTSGESRLSNFLLWQSSYSELMFVSQLWPDFTIKDYDSCCLEYSKRDRRYGGLKQPTTTTQSHHVELDL